MRLYFDTAYIAKCYLNEPGGKEVRDLARKATGLCSSALAMAELACVFHRQIREGLLTAQQALRLRSLFLDDLNNDVWLLLPVSDHLLHRVETLMRSLPSKAYVRAGDAIHLASAREAGFTEIWSNDRHLLAAAAHFGLHGRSV